MSTSYSHLVLFWAFVCKQQNTGWLSKVENVICLNNIGWLTKSLGRQKEILRTRKPRTMPTVLPRGGLHADSEQQTIDGTPRAGHRPSRHSSTSREAHHATDACRHHCSYFSLRHRLPRKGLGKCGQIHQGLKGTPWFEPHLTAEAHGPLATCTPPFLTS